MNDDTIIVGAPAANGVLALDAGAVYLFMKPTGGWTGTLIETEKLTASDGAAGDAFGGGLAAIGGIIVVAATRDDIGAQVDRGSVYVFVGDPPSVDVTANGTDGPLTLHQGESLQIDLAFDAHDVGLLDPAELYIGIATPFGVFWLSATGFVLTPTRLYAGPLTSFGPVTLINLPDVSVLPGGTYYWFMVVDDDSDEMVNGDFFDLVETTIVP